MCIYLDPPAGLMVTAAGIFWLSRVLQRDPSEDIDR